MALFSKKPQICPICSAELDGRASALRLESHWETHVVVIQPGQGDASGQYTWYCSCGPAGMKWEKHFADQADPWLPLTRLQSKPDRQRVRRALQPLTGGGTSIVPALERASQLLGTRSDRLQIVLLFSDGESGESTSALSDAVSTLPVGGVHVVVLGDALPAQWLDVPVSSVTALTDLQTADDFEWVLARALYRSLSLEWAGPTTPPKGKAGLVSTLHATESEVTDDSTTQ
ncbi:MAG TPA: vWA domain-containing protein [Acidimicrobiia bacterium]